MSQMWWPGSIGPASQLHAVCVVAGDGRIAERFEVAHDSGSLRAMVSRFRRAGVSKVAIERGDGPVVQELLAAGLAIFVVPSRQIKALRTRYGSAGNKDDRLDAYVLADTLRSDGHRWRPLREDHSDTKALRALCRARKDPVETRVQLMNQLRANLELAFPGAVGLFSRPDSPIMLAFLRRFPTAAKAAWLSPVRLDRWLKSVGYSGGIAAEVLYKRLESSGTRFARGRGRGSRPPCSQKSATAANFSRPMMPWQQWPAPHPRPANPANANRPCSGGPATRSSAQQSWISPTAAVWATSGQYDSTSGLSTGDADIPTPSASWHAPGYGSSGAAGRTTRRSISNSTPPEKTSRLDIGHSYIRQAADSGACGASRRGRIRAQISRARSRLRQRMISALVLPSAVRRAR